MKMQPSREGRASAGKRGKEHAVKPGEMATSSDTAGQGVGGQIILLHGSVQLAWRSLG